VLYSNGVIPDSKLPLMVYVGRYALDKGMDVLTEVIKRGPKEMQYVTMGVSQEYLMDELLQLSEGSHRDRLFVYTTLEEQKARFNFRDETHEVTIGQLIRAAADIFIVPSHIEACGLVAMEARCAGAMLIAPYHQGLQDICLPGSNPEHFIESDADAVCYRDHHNVEEALAATSACTKILHSMSRKERNQLAARLRNSSMENYSWFFEDAKHRTGVAMRYNHLYDRLLTQS
jgi:starch synthase